MAAKLQEAHNHSHTSSGGIAEFLSADGFDKLQSIMYPMKAKAGGLLFWEGDEASQLYYIRSGRVKLRKSTEEGKQFIFSIMNKGDLLGEYGGFANTVHSFTAEVMEDAEIGVLQIKDLEVLLYQFGDLAVGFMYWMGLTQRKTQSKFRDLLLYGKSGALASTLIRMSNSYGVESNDGIFLNIRLTNTELADLIGTTREGVNRMLSSLKEDGTISMVNGHMVIRELEELRSICNCPQSPACAKEICRI